MDRVLRWFIKIWVGIAILVNVMAITGMFMKSGFWGGISQVQDTYSPFNLINWIMELALLSPALLALWWLERRKNAYSSNDKR